MKSFRAIIIPFLLFLTGRIVSKVTAESSPHDVPSSILPHWWGLFEERVSGIMTKIRQNELENGHLQSTISKVSAVEAHFDAVRAEIQTANKLSTEQLQSIQSEKLSKALFEDTSAQIVSEIASTKLQNEQLASKMSNLSHILEKQVEELKEMNLLSKKVLQNIKMEVDCATGNFVPTVASPATNCSNYNPISEFQLPFASDRSTTHNFCKVCMYGKEHLGKGDPNGCFFPLHGGEIFVGYGHYLLRQPTGVRLTYVPGNPLLSGVTDWTRVEKVLADMKAVNLASEGPARVKGYAGICNAGILGNMPGDGGNYPVPGFLDETSPDNSENSYNLIYTYGGRAYPCNNFSLLTCANK